MIQKFVSHSERDTLAIARELGNKAEPGAVFALTGELGSGKTMIAKGIALGFGVTEEITSPTFTLLEIYSGRGPLYHFDLYRINTQAELDRLFFEEYWNDDGVSIIEWAEKAAGRLPEGYIAIRLEYLDEASRIITVERPDN